MVPEESPVCSTKKHTQLQVAHKPPSYLKFLFSPEQSKFTTGRWYEYQIGWSMR